VTVGQIAAGNAPNVIPDRASLRGTIRAVEPVSRKLMLDYNDFVVAGAMDKFDIKDSRPCK